MKKNDLLELEILDFTFDGFGIGKIDGFVVFVPNSAVGDNLLVRILKVKKSYAYGKIEKILTPSNQRITPDCPHCSKCGGCMLRHISYDAELQLKQKRVSDCIKRIAGFDDLDIEPIVPSENVNFYRNKAQLPIRRDSNGNLIAGFYSQHTHNTVDCKECRLHPQIFNDIVSTVLDWISQNNISVYNEQNNSGLIRHLYIRHAQKTNQLMVCLVINGNDIPHKNKLINVLTNNFKDVRSIVLNINTKKTNVILGEKCTTIWGQDHITDILCDLKFNISPLSFYQVNRNQAERLYTIAKDCAELNKSDTLLDLYCGTGTIGIYMSKIVNSVVGIEIVKQAIDNAIINAQVNNINNVKFICDDAKVAIKTLDIKPNVIVLDPPRKGCSLDVIKTISDIHPQKIIYISCEPSTLARDLKILGECGYVPKKVTPVDLFPRTGHVETVALMTLK